MIRRIAPTFPCTDFQDFLLVESAIFVCSSQAKVGFRNFYFVAKLGLHYFKYHIQLLNVYSSRIKISYPLHRFVGISSRTGRNGYKLDFSSGVREKADVYWEKRVGLGHVDSRKFRS